MRSMHVFELSRLYEFCNGFFVVLRVQLFSISLSLVILNDNHIIADVTHNGIKMIVKCKLFKKRCFVQIVRFLIKNQLKLLNAQVQLLELNSASSLKPCQAQLLTVFKDISPTVLLLMLFCFCVGFISNALELWRTKVICNWNNVFPSQF